MAVYARVATGATLDDPVILDPVSGTEMQAARILTGAAMALLLAAPILRGWARPVRLATAVCYLATIVALVVYHAW